jgi:uncharacterized membrane protein
LALAVVLSIAFAILAHAAIIDGVSPTVGALLSLVPLAGLALWTVRNSRHRDVMVAAIVLGAAALWMSWAQLERHFPSLFFLEHAGANLVLGVIFGRTLAAGHEPLCTRFARLIHGHLSAEEERYSRRVTLAWTVFFALVFTLSCALYLSRFLAAWSLFANIISPLLILAMFVVEYAIRVRVLPDAQRVGILGGIQAFSRHFAAARVEAPR